jgi:hypothetical protein
MPFDRTNSADLTALKTEVNTDPQSIGYNASGSTQGILDLLNTASSNTTGATTTKPISDLIVAEVAAEIDPTEYSLLTGYAQEWVKSMINQNSEASLIAYKDKFLDLFGAGSATRTNVQALLSPAASRAEELFGYGTVIDRNDWITARDS